MAALAAETPRGGRGGRLRQEGGDAGSGHPAQEARHQHRGPSGHQSRCSARIAVVVRPFSPPPGALRHRPAAVCPSLRGRSGSVRLLPLLGESCVSSRLETVPSLSQMWQRSVESFGRGYPGIVEKSGDVLADVLLQEIRLVSRYPVVLAWAACGGRRASLLTIVCGGRTPRARELHAYVRSR